MDSRSTRTQTGSDNEMRPYQLFMLMLCVYSLTALAVETFFKPSPDNVMILDVIDHVVCGIFLIDFAIGLSRASSKLEYLSWGWIDLLSSIPAYDYFRIGRLVRIFRILRVLRGIRIARILTKYLQHNRADGTILAVVFISILLLLLSSVAILQVEQVEGANINNASDALWWAIVTMTTVGYGDKYPVTTVGRIIAAVLMVGGVGMFGTLSGSVASWILNPVEERQEVDLDAIQNQLVAIHRRLDQVTSIQTSITDPQLVRMIAAWPELTEATRQELQNVLDSEK